MASSRVIPSLGRLTLQDLSYSASLNLIDPATDGDRVWNGLASPQVLYIILYSLLEVRKWLEVQPREFLLPGGPQVLLDYGMGIFVLEGQHATAGVLDEQDLIGTKQLLGDDEGAQGITGIASGVADDVGVAEAYSIGCCGVDSSVHAGD